MSCCTTSQPHEGTNRFFSRWSKRYAKDYKKKGLAKEQRFLLEGIKKEPIRSRTILDIGCGVGALHHTLLREGAARSVGIDIADGMVRQAEEFAKQFNLQDRAEYRTGDFVLLSDTIGESDVTVLDKVVCCYDNLEELLETSTGKTRLIFALTHPKENLLMRVAFKTQIALAKLFRWKFHPYWHDWVVMKAAIIARGFEPMYENSTIAWQVLVFRRI
ncbi:MAG: methyltransferase domain-containing protein [Bacteroidota bacterium]